MSPAITAPQSFAYEACDIPAGMTIREYRAQRARNRRVEPRPPRLRRALRARRRPLRPPSRPAPAQVLDEVLGLDPAGQPHEVGRHGGGGALDRLVRHRLRHLDQRLDAAERLGEREQLASRGDRRPRRDGGTQTIPEKPGQRTSDTPGALAQPARRPRAPFSACAAMRRCSVRSPRWTRKQSSGPGTAPIAFCTKRTRSCSARVAHDRPRRRRRPSARRGTSSSSARPRRRRARAGAGRRASRTCCRPRRARRRCARPRPATSITFSVGFVGVSTHTSLVSGRTARRDRVEVGLVDHVVLEAPAREHLVDEPVGAAVEVVGDDDVVARARRPR